MLLRRLQLRNIRSYEELDLPFEEGITLLSGDIGAGKSTVLQAIEFVLFGTQRASLDGESLLRHGADEGEVKLEFEIGTKASNLIEITRTLKRSSSGVRQTDCALSIDGSLESVSAQELKARVLEILGYPEALLTKSKGLIFRHTVYTPQEEMKQIVYLPLEERLNILRALFGIERYKLVKENSQLLLRDLRARERVESARAQIAPQLERELAQAALKAQEAMQEVNKAQSTLSEKEEIMKQAREALAQQRAAYEEALKIEEKRSALASRLRELERSVKNAAEDIERVSEYLSLPFEKMEDCSVTLDDARKKQYLIEKELQALTAKTSELTTKQGFHTRQANQILTLATCPVCNQKVTEEHKHAVQTQTNDAIGELQNELDSKLEREKELRKEQHDLAQKILSLNDQQRKYSVYQREQIRRGEEERRKEKLLERKESLMQEAALASETLSKLKPSNLQIKENYLLAENNARLKEEERDRAQKKLMEAKNLESSAQTQVAVLVERLGQAHAAASNAEALSLQKNWLEENFLLAVSTVEQHVLARLHLEFSELFTAYFSKLVEDETITVSLGEHFEPVITQNGYDAALEQLSGGEKTAVALSYRLGLYRVVSDFVSTIATKELLILDEPTDGFSTEQLDRVRDVLRALGCRQIILVSHEEHMESACDQVIKITKRLHRSVAQIITQ